MFIALVHIWGESYIPISEVNKHGIAAREVGQEIGLKTGDKIIAINGNRIERYDELTSPATLLESNSYYTIIRDGKEMTISIPNDLVERLSTRKGQPKKFIDPRIPFDVEQVVVGSAADDAGLQKGDKITAINGKPVSFFMNLRKDWKPAKARQLA
ncbi:MAG: PDZ domain-containing protein [Bacteroidia bacterium]|nr:PDZ domain-containing protein [Bacteroidia bacterium]